MKLPSESAEDAESNGIIISPLLIAEVVDVRCLPHSFFVVNILNCTNAV